MATSGPCQWSTPQHHLWGGRLFVPCTAPQQPPLLHTLLYCIHEISWVFTALLEQRELGWGETPPFLPQLTKLWCLLASA